MSDIKDENRKEGGEVTFEEEGRELEESDTTDDSAVSALRRPEGFQDALFSLMQQAEEKVVVPEPLPIMLIQSDVSSSIEKLATMLFGPKSDFMSALHNQVKHSDVEEGDWTIEEGVEGEFFRRIQYTVPKSSFVKEYTNYEKQIFASFGSDLLIFHTTSTTPQVPGGNAFTCEVLYIFRSLSESRTRLEVSGELVFHQGHILRAAILRGAPGPMKQTFDTYIELIKTETRAASGDDGFDILGGFQRKMQELVHVKKSSVKNKGRLFRPWKYFKRLDATAPIREKKELERDAIIALAIYEAQEELDKGQTSEAITLLGESPGIKRLYKDSIDEILARETRVDKEAKRMACRAFKDIQASNQAALVEWFKKHGAIPAAAQADNDAAAKRMLRKDGLLYHIYHNLQSKSTAETEAIGERPSVESEEVAEEEEAFDPFSSLDSMWFYNS